MKNPAWGVAPLLFLSGVCALVFQVAWFREFRLVFGASTAASAAVLAIFMGGLGLGNALLGKRADRQARPLAFYALLELSVAITAAASPLLLDLVRTVYIALGGQLALGVAGATVVRLLLAALVLGVPTVLIGGTLPAAARAVTAVDDRQRRSAAMLYGANTLGAVAGAALSTFFLLERLGTRTTLWSACLVDTGVAAVAFAWSRGFAASAVVPATGKARAQPAREPIAEVQLPAGVIYAAAAVLGFAFFLMELVWYRMLGPLLGGSTFTFGLILSVALLGIGLGGAAYALLSPKIRAAPRGLMITCGLEAALIAIPFALGDRVAIWTALLHDASLHGFAREVLGWTIVASIVVLPAALVSGYQFPLLVALLGRGNTDVGKQIGLAVAWNTAGAILGSLAGGFGLLPLLTAPGVWRAVVVLTVLLGAWLLRFSLPARGKGKALLLPGGILAAALAAIFWPGPSAVWRHSAIGAGRARVRASSANDLHAWENDQKSKILWEAEGIESSVAIAAAHGLTFIVNGKPDGNAIDDAPTQIMLGLVGGLRHAEPKTALVVGLGTGETAGAVAAIASVQRVDVVELEPALDEMARRCAAVNYDVLHHRKVRRIYNDAREVLLTTPQRYDLIISEPSNPYRNGIASLFTREFYRASRDRLRPGGLFLQWLQGYEVDRRTVRSVCATLRSVYAEVEIWQTSHNDMLLVAAERPIAWMPAVLRQRIHEEPFRSALTRVWRGIDLEGVLAHYVGSCAMVDAFIAQAPAGQNTDDRNEIEYGFARTLGREGLFDVAELRVLAKAVGAQRPPPLAAGVDWERVERQRRANDAAFRQQLPAEENLSPIEKSHRRTMELWAARDWSGAIAAWDSQRWPPQTLLEFAMLGYACAMQGDARALALAERLADFQPAEADAIRGIYLAERKQYAESAAAIAAALTRMRQDPWALPEIVGAALDFAALLSALDATQAPRLFAAVQEPFAVGCADVHRRLMACRIVAGFAPFEAARRIAALEPDIPWTASFLKLRWQVYARTGNPLSGRAGDDLEAFHAAAESP